MYKIWILVVALSCLILAGFVHSDAYLDKLAAKSIEPFCGNKTAQDMLQWCGFKYLSYGVGGLICGRSIFIESAVENGCKDKPRMGECILNTIPHDSDDCLGIDLQIPRIKEFNEYVKNASQHENEQI